MSYSPIAQMGDHHMFDNVFVNPESYKTFVQTGTWPDKTMLVLEVRGAEDKDSINQKGNFQGGVMGVEVHIKDEARFAGKWAFFSFDDGKTAKMIPASHPATLAMPPMLPWIRHSLSFTPRSLISRKPRELQVLRINTRLRSQRQSTNEAT